MDYYSESIVRFETLIEDLVMESFERGYKYKLINKTNKTLRFSFENKEGQSVMVKVTFIPPTSGSTNIRNIWSEGSLVEVNFKVPEAGKGFKTITKSGDAQQVLRTVYDIVKEFIQAHKKMNESDKYTGFILVSGVEGKDNVEGTQRNRIYQRMFQKLIPQDFPGEDLEFIVNNKEGDMTIGVDVKNRIEELYKKDTETISRPSKKDDPED